jgi:predicted nucleic acid-binding protein
MIATQALVHRAALVTRDKGDAAIPELAPMAW